MTILYVIGAIIGTLCLIGAYCKAWDREPHVWIESKEDEHRKERFYTVLYKTHFWKKPKVYSSSYMYDTVWRGKEEYIKKWRNNDAKYL